MYRSCIAHQVLICKSYIPCHSLSKTEHVSVMMISDDLVYLISFISMHSLTSMKV